MKLTQEQEDLLNMVSKNDKQFKLAIQRAFFKPQKGVWYLDKDLPKWMGRIEGDEIYGFDGKGNWFRGSYMDFGVGDNIYEAPKGIVKLRLWKEIHRRYNNGDTLKYINYEGNFKPGNIRDFYAIQYWMEYDVFSMGGSGWIYKKGIWAEVVKTEEKYLTVKQFKKNIKGLKYFGSNAECWGYGNAITDVLEILKEYKIKL